MRRADRPRVSFVAQVMLNEDESNQDAGETKMPRMRSERRRAVEDAARSIAIGEDPHNDLVDAYGETAALAIEREAEQMIADGDVLDVFQLMSA